MNFLTFPTALGSFHFKEITGGPAKSAPLTAGRKIIIWKKVGDFQKKVIKELVEKTLLGVHANYFNDLRIWHWSRAAKVAEGVLDKVGQQYLSPMHTKNKKMQWAYALLSCQKMPCKILPKNLFSKKILLRCCCCWTSSGRGSTWEKRGEKKKGLKKTAKKIRRAALCHTFILFGGSKTTSSSNSSINNNFWRGADLAGPPVIISPGSVSHHCSTTYIRISNTSIFLSNCRSSGRPSRRSPSRPAAPASSSPWQSRPLWNTQRDSTSGMAKLNKH